MTSPVLAKGDRYATRSRGVAEYRGYEQSGQLEIVLVWMLINENRFFRTIKSGRCQYDNESEEDVEGLPSTFMYHPTAKYNGPYFVSEAHPFKTNSVATQTESDEEHVDSAKRNIDDNHRRFRYNATGLIKDTSQLTIEYNGQEYIIAVDNTEGPGRGKLVLRTANLKRLCIEPAAANSVNFSVKDQ